MNEDGDGDGDGAGRKGAEQESGENGTELGSSCYFTLPAVLSRLLCLSGKVSRRAGQICITLATALSVLVFHGFRGEQG